MLRKFSQTVMVALALTLISLFTACSSDKDDDRLQGRYNCNSVLSSDYRGLIAQFNSDGTGYFGLAVSTNINDFDSFTNFKVEGGKLYVMWVGDDEWDYQGDIKIADGADSFQIIDAEDADIDDGYGTYPATFDRVSKKNDLTYFHAE